MTIYKPRSLNGGGLSPSGSRIYLSRNNSGTVPQWCELEKSGPTIIEQLKNLAVDDEKWRYARLLTPVPHGAIGVNRPYKWPYSWTVPHEWTSVWMIVQLPPGSWRQVGLLLQVYIFGFVNLTTSAAPWTVCTWIFIQDPTYGKLSTAASSVGSRAQSLTGWLSPSCIFT